MRRKQYILLIISITILSGCSSGKAEDYITFVSVDPLEKIFRETVFFSPADNVVEAGLGEYATFQFALRSAVPLNKVKIKVDEPQNGKVKLSVDKTGLVKYVHVSRLTPNPANDRLVPLSGFYPDPIVDAAPFNLKPNDTQPFWITIKIPASTPAGQYTGEVKLVARVSGKKISFKQEIKIIVYPVDLTSTSLLVTNWFFDDKLEQCNNNNPVEPFSERYWELVEKLVKTMTAYRQNVAWIDPLALTQCTKEDTLWKFNFDHFNRMARLLIGTGSMKRLEGKQIATRETNWTSRFVMQLPVTSDSMVKLPLTDNQVTDFYSSFIPALRKNLESNGWDKIYMQHIADEPITENRQSYKEISAFIKSLWPEVKVIEACHSNDLVGSVDVWVPQMNFLEEDFEFYKSRQESGEEVWYYTCLAPQGEYANRFLELPLIKTRLLHWVNFRYGITGYLHWGFNYWNKEPWNETSGIITESGNILPGGDSWIVYPAFDKIYSSVRLEAMRDGIADYELLNKYYEKYPERAAGLVREVVYNFRRYDTDIPAFRQKRHQMLTELSEAR